MSAAEIKNDNNAMDLGSPAVRESLERYLTAQTSAKQVTIKNMARLSGGAIQENWGMDVVIEGGSHAGEQSWVLRTDAASAVAVSLGRPQEFAVLSVAHAAGVTVPQPLW